MAFSTCSSPIRLSELLTCALLSTMCKRSVRSPVNDQSGPYKITGEVLSQAAQRPEATGEALDRIRKEIYSGGWGFGLTITRRSEFASCLAQLSFFPARGCPHRSRVESGVHTAAR